MSTQRKSFTNKSNKIALSIDEMYSHLRKLSGGWPKTIGGDLCYQNGEELESIGSSQELFAWIDKFAVVTWSRGLTKDEFFEGLRQRAERFAWASPYPHFPPIPGVFYTCIPPAPKNTGALAKLVDRFAPASPLDRLLLIAVVLTLFWGGPAGRRPSFVLTSRDRNDGKHGRGIGKTTLVELISQLVGGYISVRLNTSHDRIISGFLSPAAWAKRVALMDNLKTYRLSSELVESLITCSDINGHRLHKGFATRPNYLTWIVTINGASFAKDMAQRSVVIFLKRVEFSAKWYAETAKFITEQRANIIADVRWHLEKKASAVAQFDRWPDWDQSVLARVGDPTGILQEIEQRRTDIDDDDQDCDDIIDHIRACLIKAGISSPDIATAEIDSLQLAKWLCDLKRELSTRQASTLLRQLDSPRLQYRRFSDRRYYRWTGANATADQIPTQIFYRGK